MPREWLRQVLDGKTFKTTDLGTGNELVEYPTSDTTPQAVSCGKVLAVDS